MARGGGMARASGGAFSSGPKRRPAVLSKTVKHGKTTRQLALASLRQIQKLARQVEIKTTGNAAVSLDMGTTGGNLVSLVDMAQGDGDGNRTGNQIHFKRHEIRLKFGSYVQSNLTYRVIVFQDKQTASGVTPTTAEVLNLTAGAATTLCSYNSSYLDRFKILADQTIAQNASFAGQDMSQSMTIVIKNYLQEGLVSYGGAAATACDKNRIWMFVVADYAAPGSVVTQGFAVGEGTWGYQYLADYTDA